MDILDTLTDQSHEDLSMPKTILPKNFSRSFELHISDTRWEKLRNHIPTKLSAEADARLRNAIIACCSWLLTQQARLHEGQATAAALRRRGKGQAAPFERLAKGLRMAANAWNEIGEIYDDRLFDLRRFDDLDALARDAERRLSELHRLGEPIAITPPWRVFVRKVARCCREASLNPKVTGRVYEHADPTWFQQFIAAIDRDLLGSKGLLGIDSKGEQFVRDHRALYAEIAKAMRGDAKPGKARK